MLRNLIFTVLFAFSFSIVPSSLNADIVVFDFRDEADALPVDEFDGGGVGASATIDGLTLTTVDILAPEYADDGTGTFVATGTILSAADGDNVETNIAGNQDAIGINNGSIGNTAFDNFIGSGTESSDLNSGEAWVFNFDREVDFTELEVESAVAGNILRVLVDGVLVETYDAPNGRVDSSNGLGALAGFTIAAGSEVTFEIDGPLFPQADENSGQSTDFRIESFTVHAKAVPEPSSLFVVVGMAGLFAVRRRR